MVHKCFAKADMFLGKINITKVVVFLLKKMLYIYIPSPILFQHWCLLVAKANVQRNKSHVGGDTETNTCNSTVLVRRILYNHKKTS